MYLTTPTTSSIEGIPSGAQGVRATLKRMTELVRKGKVALPVRLKALSLVKRNGGKDWKGEIKNIHAYVRDKIRYVKDIRGVETLTTPEKMLEIQQGDCDDKSMLVAALLESIGHPTRFIAVSFSPFGYSHVLVETRVGAKWIALETTENVPVGWRPPGIVKRMIQHN